MTIGIPSSSSLRSIPPRAPQPPPPTPPPSSLRPPSPPEVIVPVSSQKHDPAWKHCFMVKKGDKTHLKCMYCFKVFYGGGIHRIKEHLACQKGNASSCSKVPLEVQHAMTHSLESVVVRKKKKQRLAEEVKKINPVTSAGTSSQFDPIIPSTNSHLLALTSPVDAIGSENEGFSSAKASERGKKKKTKPSSVQLLSSAPEATLEKDRTHKSIGCCLYETGIPLSVANSIRFQRMFDVFGAVSSYAPPSYTDLRGWILKDNFEETRQMLERFKSSSWVRTGCSLLADEWMTSGTDRTLINFMVYCQQDTMFIKCVDATQIVTSPDALYELLKHMVEEIGVPNIVQVITNNTETHIAAGRRLTDVYPTLFWSPCSTRCIDDMLDDMAKLNHVSLILEQAKSLTGFIYNHVTVLNMMRTYTGGRDLVQASISRSVTNFRTLSNLVKLKDSLMVMVTSADWLNSWYSKEHVGILLAGLICNHTFWSSATSIVRITNPLIQALKIAESDSRPAMGYVYMSLLLAKEFIRREFKKKKRFYMPYWNIIDWRWERDGSNHCPLHMAGYFLNPQFFYRIQGNIPNEIMSGMLDCIERLVPDVNVQDKINKELGLYKNAEGDFGRKMAVRARNTLLPAEWWSTYGGACPNLSRLALRILNQTCSVNGCDRTQISFEQVHTQRMNSLEHQRLTDLIFVQYNLRLQQKKRSKKKILDPMSIDSIDVAEDWVTEKSELYSSEDSEKCSNWMQLFQPVANVDDDEDDNDLFSVGFDEEGDLHPDNDDDDDDDEGDVSPSYFGNN